MKNIMNKVVAGVVAGGIMLSGSTVAFAKSIDDRDDSSRSEARYEMLINEKVISENPINSLKVALDKLVAAGTISVEEETQLLNFVNLKPEDRKQMLQKINELSKESVKDSSAEVSREDRDRHNDDSEI